MLFFRCKLDETIKYHQPGPNSQRISFEAFTFVGAEDSVAYLQCDVVVCDSQDPNSRCNAGCLPAARRRRAPLIISETKSVGKLSSGPMIITSKRLSRPRRAVQVVTTDAQKTGLSPKYLNQSGKSAIPSQLLSISRTPFPRVASSLVMWRALRYVRKKDPAELSLGSGIEFS